MARLWKASVAPVLPTPRDGLDVSYMGRLLNVLRLYFNQVDAATIGSREAIQTLQQSVTEEYLYIPTSAGAPGGTPDAYTGHVAMVYDTTGDDLYVYNGSWKKVHLA